MTLLPANIDLAGAEAMLLMRAGREYALKRRWPSSLPTST
jgi:chromosome partitioning protein